MWTGPGPLAYVVKRYPRLTETFILNEIRAMERLGYELHIFTLLPPEPPPHHPMVEEVQASVSYLPVALPAKVAALVRSHAAAFVANPVGYARAFCHALHLMAVAPTPLSTIRQFLRAGFFAGIARRLGITHLHAHFANAPAAVAHCLSMMTGLPFSFTAHAKDLYLTHPQIVRQRAGAATFVATCTGYNADFLRDVVATASQSKINLIYHGIDLSLFRYRPPAYRFLEQGTEPLILCVGRLVPKKGLDDLIAACQALAMRGLRFRCEIIGSGPLRDELAADIAARGLTERVMLCGSMTHANLIERFAQADMFVLAPRITENGDRDGIPNVIVEAMATGVPVVSTAVSGIPEMVVDNETGLLVPSRDPAGLADAMLRLLTDPELGRRLAGNARARLDHSFDCWQTTQQLAGLIDTRSSSCVASLPPTAQAEVA